MENRKKDIRQVRLEKLKEEMILRFSDSLNFDSEMELYEHLLVHLFTGDLDDVFLSESLLGIDGNEKSEIMNLARKYMSLCFYDGDISYWADSIDGVYLSDLDLVCMKLLDNFDFLLGLAKDGGEDVLQKLVSFQNTSLTGTSSVIDALRNIFVNDDVLKDTLFKLLKDNGPYQGLSSFEKKVLLEYPEGVFYQLNGENIQKISPEELKNKLLTTYFGTIPEENITFESFGKLFPTEDSFEQVVLDTHFENGYMDSGKQGAK